MVKRGSPKSSMRVQVPPSPFCFFKEKPAYCAMALFDQTLQLFVVVGQITAGPPLAPLLGQYDIKPANEFISKLNEFLQEFEPGVPLAVSVRRNSKSKDYKFVLNGPTLMALIDNVSKRTQYRKIEFLTFYDIYDIICIRHAIWSKFRSDSCPPVESIAKSVFSTISSTNLGVQRLSREERKKYKRIRRNARNNKRIQGV